MSRQLLETIRCEHGSAQHLPYHQRRLEKSLKAINSTAHYDLAALITPPDEHLYRCRVLYDEAYLDVQYIPYQKRVIQQLQAIEADHLDYALKYADRTALDELFTQRGSSDDILIIKNGLVTDTTIANIAFFDAGRWITPTDPLLKGTTRARLIAEKKIFEQTISVDDLNRFEGFALMNAMIGFENVKNGIISPIKGI